MTLRIQRIDHIRGIGSFRDWSCGDLSGFMRYNLIYSWSGSRKTTLARLLRMFETGQLHDAADIELLDFQVTLDDGSALNRDDIERPRIAVHVFGEEFLRENLQFDAATASPLLILGEDRIEAAEERDDLRQISGVVGGDLESIRTEQRMVSRNLDRLLSDTRPP